MATHEAPGTAEGLTELVDAVIETVEHARAMPMSASVLVNRAELLSLLDQVKLAMPDQLSRADELLSEADEVKQAARAEAERIISAARKRAAALVDKEPVVAAAEARAAATIARGETAATTLMRDADDYCDRRLADFEIDLGRINAQVTAGRAKLAARLSDNIRAAPAGDADHTG
jgi:cell division septum initiation protein DivIVA